MSHRRGFNSAQNTKYDSVPLESYDLADTVQDFESIRPETVSTRSLRQTTSTQSLLHVKSVSNDGEHVFRGPGFARVEMDWWRRQMLVDRTLRSMAALTIVLALVILIVVLSYAKPFSDRINPFSTSVGRTVGSCKTVRTTNMFLLFLINIAATMVLGMSNTYQQLVTALKTDELKYALEKYGDSRVGTNSPFYIKHKRTGKLKSWMAWLLLVVTSLPVHLLVNSLIGPSYVVDQGRLTIERQSNATVEGIGYSSSSYTRLDSSSFQCWSLFRTGKVIHEYDWQTGMENLDFSYDGYSGSYIDYARQLDVPPHEKQYSRVIVTYNGTCDEFSGTADSSHDLTTEFQSGGYYNQPYYGDWRVGNCTMVSSYTSSRPAGPSIGRVGCTYEDPIDTQCRLNVRMLAAFILLGCLIIKAVYMVTVNVRARGAIKTTCLTFGDVLVAAAADPQLRTHGECMVNADDHYRHLTTHTCHKHCTEKLPSKTGDELGHCQKCKKFNSKNKSPNLEQPRTATKFKRSLVSLLGGSTLPQLILLSMCSCGLIILIGFMAAGQGYVYEDRERTCRGSPDKLGAYCQKSGLDKYNSLSGGWDSRAMGDIGSGLANEFYAMLIANSAQTFYSFIYLLLIYNFTLISQEYAWGKLERERGRLRCTINRGHKYEESYLLQLPKKVLFPLMAASIMIHWLLGEAIQMKEYVWRSDDPAIERSYFAVHYSTYPIFLTAALIIGMTVACWWAYSFSRQGFIPQMYGSIRVCCAAATELNEFSEDGIMWGDLGEGKKWRHAGFSAGEVGKIRPHELYAGRGGDEKSTEVRGIGKEEQDVPMVAEGAQSGDASLVRRLRPRRHE